MRIKFLLYVLLLLPLTIFAQVKSSHAWGDRLLLGVHYGFEEDYVGDRDNQYEVAHFAGAKAGVSINRQLYGGIQARFIKARNFETSTQNFYMAGIWGRYYVIHPVQKVSSNRFGLFLESGFMLGNYAFENRNFVEYAFLRPGSWYIPAVLGAEFRVWSNLTLEGSCNLFYNNGGSWDDQGIAYLSLGLNWHW